MITLTSLREAESFNHDITKIMSLVSGIEQDYAFQKINEQISRKKHNLN